MVTSVHLRDYGEKNRKNVPDSAAYRGRETSR